MKFQNVHSVSAAGHSSHKASPAEERPADRDQEAAEWETRQQSRSWPRFVHLCLRHHWNRRFVHSAGRRRLQSTSHSKKSSRFEIVQVLFSSAWSSSVRSLTRPSRPKSSDRHGRDSFCPSSSSRTSLFPQRNYQSRTFSKRKGKFGTGNTHRKTTGNHQQNYTWTRERLSDFGQLKLFSSEDSCWLHQLLSNLQRSETRLDTRRAENREVDGDQGNDGRNGIRMRRLVDIRRRRRRSSGRRARRRKDR